MTVASNTPYVQYSATAAQTVFNYTFEIVQQEDILVYQRGENDAPDDAADLLVLNVDYTVAGVGNENGGTITLAVAATLNDVVTLKQNLTVERDTSFTTGGVLRAQDLNDEFDNQTLIQQVTRFNEDSRMLYYPDSAILTPFVDNILPVLGANQVWAKNAADTAIVAYDVPSGGGIAPSDATYLVQTADAELPNAQAMGALASGIVVNTTTTGVQLTRTLTGTANQIDIANGNGISGNPTASISANPVLTGTAGMGIPAGTTAQRIVPTPPSIGLRFNTDLDQPEYYDILVADWVQIQSSGDIANLIAQLAAHTAGDGASMIGLEDQGTVSNKTVQDLAEASFVTVNDDTATLLNSQQLSALALLLAGGTMAGTIDMDSNVITGLPLPTAATEAVSKAYVDGLVLNIIPACDYATTANLTGYTYANGTAGVGATLTAGANGAFSTDGASPALNDRIFVSFQTAQEENGIYTLSTVGDGSNPAILTRATDWDVSADMQAGDTVVVVGGTLYAGSHWMMSQTATITVGTTAITWIDISIPDGIVTIAGAQTITGDKTLTGETTIDGNVTSNNTSIGIDVDLNYPNQTSKNLIIGGNFSTNPWQRGITFTGVASGTYTADRWSLTGGNDGVVDITKSTAWPAAAAIYAENSLRYAVTTADATIAAAQSSRLLYKVEGYDFINIRGRTFTLSFWVRAVKTGTYCVGFVNAGFDRSYVAEYTIDASDTWEFKTITVSASPNAGTWNYTNGVGLQINFTIAAGTNFQTTADTWQTGLFVATANQVNGMDSVSNIFYIQMVQLETGEVATPFEQRSRGQELALCQRYFYKTYDQGVNPGTATNQGALTYYALRAGVGGYIYPVNFPVNMRASSGGAGFTFYGTTGGAAINWYSVTRAAASGALTIIVNGEDKTHIVNPQVAADGLNDQFTAHFTVGREL